MDEIPGGAGYAEINEDALSHLNFNEKGLIPAAVQDYISGRMLMLAYMNRESLEISMRERRTCFFSRSRNQLWRKGETSGNVQTIISIKADCYFNSLLVQAITAGPACHTGEFSCFYNTVYAGREGNAEGSRITIGALYDLIKSRKSEMPDGSYTAYLFKGGLEKILKKVGEESAETIIAAMKGDAGEAVRETADLCYHMLVLLCEMGIEPGAIAAELGRRHAEAE